MRIIQNSKTTLMPLEHREVIAMNVGKTNPPSLVPRSTPSLFMDLKKTVKPTLRSLTPFETSIDAKQTKDSLLIWEPVPWTRLVNWKVKLAWSHMPGNDGNLEGTLSNGGSCPRASAKCHHVQLWPKACHVSGVTRVQKPTLLCEAEVSPFLKVRQALAKQPGGQICSDS